LFAVDEPHPQRTGERRRSIHVFDSTGTAVHKIYLEPEGNAKTWDAVIAARTVASRPITAQLELAQAQHRERADAEIDRAGLIAGWDAMTDTHEFFHLLGKFGASRTQAMRLAGESRARRVYDTALEQVLHEAAETGDRIMIFVGNRGCIQVFSGAVHRIIRHGPWITVLDPDFNLHLQTSHIGSSWVVAKPTRTGVVSSLELYDDYGETIALVFRKRDDRERAEDPAWRGVLDRLPAVSR
jgi:putative hemin transport protein